MGSTILNKLFIIVIIMELLAGCTIQQDRSDAEMLAAANEVYQDYLFEYGIDSALFSSPIVKTRPNGDKSYKWMAKGLGGTPVGVEVIVEKINNKKPEMILIGDTDVWLPLIGSKNKRRGNEEGAP